MANKDQWTAIQSGLASQVAKLAGTYANTHGGSWDHAFEQLMNVVQTQISSTAATTPGSVAVNKSFADSLGAVAAAKFNLPQIAGRNAGVQATSQQATENAGGLPSLQGQAAGTKSTAQQATENAGGLPSMQGAAEEAKARAGGAAAAGLTRAAQEENTPRALDPTQRLVTPAVGSLTGGGAAAA